MDPFHFFYVVGNFDPELFSLRLGHFSGGRSPCWVYYLCPDRHKGRGVIIVFVRHAKAQERKPGFPDMDRALTDRGKCMVSEALPYLKKQLKRDQRIHIFTSPAARALQTAQIISTRLGLKHPMVQLEDVYTGETEALFRELALLPDDSCAIVVGHEPYLGQFCKEIIGEQIVFRKIGMAGLSRSQASPLKAVISWLYRAERDSTDNVMIIPNNDFLSIMDFQHVMRQSLHAIIDARNEFMKHSGYPNTVFQCSWSKLDFLLRLFQVAPI